MNKYTSNSSKECALEDDLEYPKELRQLHNDYPLVPDKIEFKRGLKLKTIHCVLEFHQSQWLKQYVEFNTQKRIEAENNGDKDGKALYKLMNNAVYGKTMENVRNRIDVKLASNKKDYLKWSSKPNYMSRKIFDNDLVAIRKNKVTLTLNKHAYIGLCILELSKVLMHELHYH